MPDQKIETQLFPLTGWTVSPSTPEGEIRLAGDIAPRLAIVAAQGTNGLVIVEATNDGALKTADTGSGLTLVEVATGIATDTLTDLALSDPFTSLIITVKNAPLQITYETATTTYSTAFELSVGPHVREITALDLQVANQQAGNPSTYQIEAYR